MFGINKVISISAFTFAGISLGKLYEHHTGQNDGKALALFACIALGYALSKEFSSKK